MNLLERYREQATWARAQAEKAETPELREQWLNVALQYEQLAVEPTRTEASGVKADRPCMAISVGDTVAICWRDTGRSDRGTVEKVFGPYRDVADHGTSRDHDDDTG